MNNKFKGNTKYIYMEKFTNTLDNLSLKTRQEQYTWKAAIGIEVFLQKATGGNVALSDITVENGRIKGLDAPFDKLLNDPGQNQAYLDYRADVLAIKNYERMQGAVCWGGSAQGTLLTGRQSGQCNVSNSKAPHEENQ